MYKLGFIGCGNMATAIIGGVVSSEFLKGEEICVFDVDKSKAEFLNKEYGVNTSSTVEEIAGNCEFIVLAVKPQVFPIVLPQIKEYVKDSQGILTNGDGVTKDYAEAVKWYRKAAEQGVVQAQHNLGLMYAYGEGVEQDAEAARAWYGKAAAQGHEEAREALQEPREKEAAR